MTQTEKSIRHIKCTSINKKVISIRKYTSYGRWFVEQEKFNYIEKGFKADVYISVEINWTQSQLKQEVYFITNANKAKHIIIT